MKLGTRIMILVAVISLLIGIFAIVLSGPVIKQGFADMDKEWIESLTVSLSEGIAHDTINGNAARARQVLESVVLRNKELDYAYVVGFDQDLFVHTFKDGFPEKLVDIFSADQLHKFDHHHSDQVVADISTQQNIHSEKLNLDGANVTDISYPIIEGMSARLHLGLNDKADEALVQAIDQKLVMIIFTLGLFGILLAYPVSRQLTRPLERFGRLMQDYGSDKLQGPVEIPQSSTEINKLSDAFNAMTEARTVAEVTLQQQFQLNKTITDNAASCLFMMNKQGHPTFMNPAAETVTGYELDEIKGKPLHDAVHYKYPDGSPYPMSECPIDNAQAELKVMKDYEDIFARKDGSLFPVICYIAPLEQDGEVVGSVLEFRDVTDQKQAESALQKAHEELEKRVEDRTQDLRNAQEELVRKGRLATLGQLTATVSHELRNPLAAMRPSLYFIQKNTGAENEKLRQAVERLDRNVTRCDHIIDELLDFTRVTDMELKTVVFDDWLESILVENLVPEEIQFRRELSLGDLEVDIDPNRLRRAVVNTIENACHAMREGEDPNRVIENARLTVTTETKAGRIEIGIQDTGIGIPEDVVEKIFEPLFSTKSFGVGLGMPVIEQIMEQHGGGIDIDSEVGKGTTVILWMPLAR